MELIGQYQLTHTWQSEEGGPDLQVTLLLPGQVVALLLDQKEEALRDPNEYM